MKEGRSPSPASAPSVASFATLVNNYPQAGILGIGRIMKTPIVKEDEIVGNIMPLSLGGSTHRGWRETTRFLARVMGYLSDPLSLMMDES